MYFFAFAASVLEKLKFCYMKNVLIYLAGFISGIVFLIVIALFVNDASADNGVEGLTVFEQPADVIPSYSFEVFQVVQNGNALARMGERKSYGTGYTYYGMVVLLLADENTHYYDDQIVNVPKGKCAMQIGTYQYETKDGYKTVPVVGFYDNDAR